MGSIPNSFTGIVHWQNPSSCPGVKSASKRNEYLEYFLGSKGNQCVRPTILPPSCANCLEIWQPNLLEPYGPVIGLNRDCFTIGFFNLYTKWFINNKMKRIMIPYNVPELKLKRPETYGTMQNKVSASQDIGKRDKTWKGSDHRRPWEERTNCRHASSNPHKMQMMTDEELIQTWYEGLNGIWVLYSVLSDSSTQIKSPSASTTGLQRDIIVSDQYCWSLPVKLLII